MQRDTLKEDLQYIANYNLPYEQLKGRSVLVTGATGLIGTLLVRALLAIGDIKSYCTCKRFRKSKENLRGFDRKFAETAYCRYCG